MTAKSLFLLMILSLQAGCAHATMAIQPVGCEANPQLQAQRSAELEAIAKEDQADRVGSFESLDWNKVNSRDLQRRIRVAAIFAEGCFKGSDDYASAATVYQHGTTADHYYQAFIWANKAVQLGDQSQLWWTAAALDRYLVKMGQKQLFGTQLSKNTSEKWCVQAVESSFPEATRIKYVKLSVKEQIANTLKGMGSSQNPAEVPVCNPSLKPSPQGTIPGFW
ncbi:MAG: hypothetical protein AAGB31_15375 [Bdellovibrio sp.]